MLLVLQYAARIQHGSLVWFSWRGWFFGMVSVVNVVLVVHLVLGYGSCDLDDVVYHASVGPLVPQHS